jgi:hypothetical protein
MRTFQAPAAAEIARPISAVFKQESEFLAQVDPGGRRCRRAHAPPLFLDGLGPLSNEGKSLFETRRTFDENTSSFESRLRLGKITPDMLQGRTTKEPSKASVGEEEQSRSHGLAR